MNELAEQAEQMAPLSEEELDDVMDQYEMLLGEFRANLNTYSKEEKQQICQDIGRINGVLAKQATFRLLEGFASGVSVLPSLLEGFISGWDVDDSLPLDSWLEQLEEGVEEFSEILSR